MGAAHARKHCDGLACDKRCSGNSCINHPDMGGCNCALVQATPCTHSLQPPYIQNTLLHGIAGVNTCNRNRLSSAPPENPMHQPHPCTAHKEALPTAVHCTVLKYTYTVPGDGGPPTICSRREPKALNKALAWWFLCHRTHSVGPVCGAWQHPPWQGSHTKHQQVGCEQLK